MTNSRMTHHEVTLREITSGGASKDLYHDMVLRYITVFVCGEGVDAKE